MTIEEVNKALQVLVNAINLAQGRGAYTLEESASIFAAIQSFNNKDDESAPPAELPTPEVEEEEK